MSGITDPIADLLTRLRNGSSARKRYVDIPKSKMKEGIARILEKHRLVAYVLTDPERPMMRVFLRYGPGRKPMLHSLKRVSRPGKRCYVGYQKIPTLFGGMGLTILSTPKGLMTATAAKEQKVGGELLCQVW